MNWVTIIWSMVASACLTLAMIHLLVWWRERHAWNNLWFGFAAIGTAGMGVCEYWMMQAADTAEFGAALRWLHVAAWVLIVALVGFVRAFLRAGRPWLAWTVCGMRTLSLVLNFVQSPNLNFREITGLRPVDFLGQTVAVGEGTPNHSMLVGQVSLLLLVIFVVDAMLTVWRRGECRRAVLVGGGITFFVLLGSVQSVLVLWHAITTPLTPSLFFLGIIVAVGYELSLDVLNAGRLARELAQQRAELVRMNRVSTMGELAASLAHELNQPLTGILSNAQAGQLLLRRQPPDISEVQEVFDSVIADTRRASEIIRQMRDFLCRRDPPRQAVDLNEVIEQMLQLLGSETALHDLTIEAELAPALPLVLGDRVQWQQVILNLLLNAQQAMAGMSPSFRRLVVRSGTNHSGGVWLAVEDSGPGFDAASLERVFEPFYTTRPDGMGMGLAICRSIVEAHAGQIRAANRPEGGARITIELLAASAHESAAGQSGLAASQPETNSVKS